MHVNTPIPAKFKQAEPSAGGPRVVAGLVLIARMMNGAAQDARAHAWHRPTPDEFKNTHVGTVITNGYSPMVTFDALCTVCSKTALTKPGSALGAR